MNLFFIIVYSVRIMRHKGGNGDSKNCLSLSRKNVQWCIWFSYTVTQCRPPNALPSPGIIALRFATGGKYKELRRKEGRKDLLCTTPQYMAGMSVSLTDAVVTFYFLSINEMTLLFT